MTRGRHSVRLVEVLSDGLVALSFDHDVALWASCKVRKPHTCAVTGEVIEPGQRAFRPVGNQEYRMQRVQASVVDRAR